MEGSGSGSGGMTEGVSVATSETSGPTTETNGSTNGPTTEPTTDPSTGTTEAPCDDPQLYYFDGDGDGFGDPELALETCDPPRDYVDVADDCDDGNMNVYLGADELCDGVDNDCDGDKDEYSATNTGECGECEPLVGGDRVYYFCSDTDTWDGARASCIGRGADLTSITSDAEFQLLWTKLKALPGRYWIGAGDREEEGTYVWNDGTPLSSMHPGWAQGEPVADEQLTKVDCVSIGGGWLNASPGRMGMEFCDPLVDLRWVCEGELEP